MRAFFALALAGLSLYLFFTHQHTPTAIVSALGAVMVVFAKPNYWA